jgi:hypothetical protein
MITEQKSSHDEQGDLNMVDLTPPPTQSLPLLLPVEKVGFVLFVEKLMGSDTVLWSEDKFFRLTDAPKNFRPLTPILFQTTFVAGSAIGKYAAPSYLASFTKIILDDQSYDMPIVKGIFSRKGSDKITFSFNPNGLLSHPALCSFSLTSFPNIPCDSEVLVKFAIRAPRFSSDIPYPLSKM